MYSAHTLPRKAFREPKHRRVLDVYTNVYIYLTIWYRETLCGNESGPVFIECINVSKFSPISSLLAKKTMLSSHSYPPILTCTINAHTHFLTLIKFSLKQVWLLYSNGHEWLCQKVTNTCVSKQAKPSEIPWWYHDHEPANYAFTGSRYHEPANYVLAGSWYHVPSHRNVVTYTTTQWSRHAPLCTFLQLNCHRLI